MNGTKPSYVPQKKSSSGHTYGVISLAPESLSDLPGAMLDDNSLSILRRCRLGALQVNGLDIIGERFRIDDCDDVVRVDLRVEMYCGVGCQWW